MMKHSNAVLNTGLTPVYDLMQYRTENTGLKKAGLKKAGLKKAGLK